MNPLQTAQYWAGQGFSTIPIRYYGKQPLTMKLPDGKWEKFQTHLPTDAELNQMFASNLTNIGLIINNSLVVIDFDVQEVFDYWFSLFPLKTYMVKTRRGVHVYIKTHQPAKNYHSELLDIKAERGYVLIPPSIHPSGYQYQVFDPSPILSVEKLEDVLPKEFTPEPEKVAMENVVAQYEADPWAAADNAIDIEVGAIADIRSRISILSIVGGAEKSSSDGRWYVALCPFHEDHTPSFWIDTQRGICGCWKCNIKEMDVINLYARLHNVDNRTAIYELAKVK